MLDHPTLQRFMKLPTLQRILKDPIALAIALTVPALLLLYDPSWDPVEHARHGWHFGHLWNPDVWDQTEYNHTALIIIWAVAIIRWKWQKEDKAKQG